MNLHSVPAYLWNCHLYLELCDWECVGTDDRYHQHIHVLGWQILQKIKTIILQMQNVRIELTLVKQRDTVMPFLVMTGRGGRMPARQTGGQS